MTRISST
ncbi:hypothetical protein LINPERPRIM_LOCUS39072 [Linum perenne]